MIRDMVKKAAGLFMEFDDDGQAQIPSKPEEWNVMTATGPDGSAAQPPTPAPVPKTKTIEQIVREQPGPNLDEIKVPAEATGPAPAAQPAAPIVNADGSINFPSIYQLANLPKVPYTAEEILELFATLPADLPLDTKRATIRVTLAQMAKTLGVTTEQLVADASRKLAALAAYNDSFAKQAADYCSKADIEISTLEQQIDEKKKAIEAAKTQQTTMHEACVKESDRLDDVLEFFSLDVPPSKLAQ